MAGMYVNRVSAILAIIVFGMATKDAIANSRSHFDTTSTAGSEGSAVATSFLERRSVEFTLNQSLQETLVSVVGQDSKSQSMLTRIEGSIWQTFQSMPKNMHGRLAPRAVRYIVHNYFAKEHGWLIHGLEANGREMHATEVHQVQILQDRAPALVEALLSERKHARGLGLSEVIAMVATLEQLIFDESTKLLDLVYELNGKSTADDLSTDDTYEVLMSYLMLYESGAHEGITPEAHQKVKSILHEMKPKPWEDLKMFADDSLLNFNYARRYQANPFTGYRHSFEDVIIIVGGMALRYGKWQNADCRIMKEELMDLDTEGYGTVSLKAFYSQPVGASHAFEESVEYLQNIGALDDSMPNNPRVRIANYVNGPSNCIAQQTYYAVCCLNECEMLMNELESQIQAPAASAGQLLALVRNLWSSSVDAPRELSEQLDAKLHQIAASNKGEVPLHGRLFSQWMHYAFPNECPFPQSATNPSALTTDHWIQRRHAASDEEKQKHISSSICGGENSTNSSGCARAEQMSLWSDEEALPFVEATGLHFTDALRFAALGAAILALLKAACAAWSSSAGSFVAPEKPSDAQLSHVSLYV